MSERTRHRWLFVKNRLEELATKYGPPPVEPLPTVDMDPTWGPVGSLVAAHLTADEMRLLLARHLASLTLERSRHPAPPSPIEPKGSDW